MSQIYQFTPSSKAGNWICKQKATSKSFLQIGTSKLSLLFVASLKSEPMSVVYLYEHMNDLMAIEGQLKREQKHLQKIIDREIPNKFTQIKGARTYPIQASVYPAILLCRVMELFDSVMGQIEILISHQVFRNTRLINRKYQYHKQTIQKWLGKLIGSQYKESTDLDDKSLPILKKALKATNLMRHLDQEELAKHLQPKGEE
tara:strand:- start:15068 stop:15673 length:606 start_codon:yes stop_codon:yes gene_type:complete